MIYRVPGLRSYDSSLLPPHPPHTHPLPPPLPSASCRSFSVFLCIAGRVYCRERLTWSKIIRLRENLALYKSFITLCQGAQTRNICPKCTVLLQWNVCFSYLNKGSSPALSLSSLSGKLKLPTFKVRMSYNMCTVVQRAEEPKLNCLLEPEPKLQVAAPAPFYLPQLEEIL
jgi:hypothetical protein